MKLFFVEVRIIRWKCGDWNVLIEVSWKELCFFWIIEHGSFSASNWQINDEHVLTFFLFDLLGELKLKQSSQRFVCLLESVEDLEFNRWKRSNPSTCKFVKWDLVRILNENWDGINHDFIYNSCKIASPFLTFNLHNRRPFLKDDLSPGAFGPTTGRLSAEVPVMMWWLNPWRCWYCMFRGCRCFPRWYLPWDPKTVIFRSYNPYMRGSKPSMFMVLGSKGSDLNIGFHALALIRGQIYNLVF